MTSLIFSLLFSLILFLQIHFNSTSNVDFNTTLTDHAERLLWLSFFNSLQSNLTETNCTTSCTPFESSQAESQQHSHWQPLTASSDSVPVSWFDLPIDKLMRRYALSSLDSSMLTVNVSPSNNSTSTSDLSSNQTSSSANQTLLTPLTSPLHTADSQSLQPDVVKSNLQKLLLEQFYQSANQSALSTSNLDNSIIVYPPEFQTSAEDNDQNDVEPQLARSYPRTAETRPMRTRYRHPTVPYYDSKSDPNYRHPTNKPIERPNQTEQPMKAIRNHRPMNGGFRPSPRIPAHMHPSYPYLHEMQMNPRRPTYNRPRSPPSYSTYSSYPPPQYRQKTRNGYSHRPAAYQTDLDRATSSTFTDHHQIAGTLRGRNQPQELSSSSTSSSSSPSSSSPPHSLSSLPSSLNNRNPSLAYGKRLNGNVRQSNGQNLSKMYKQSIDQLPEVQDPNESYAEQGAPETSNSPNELNNEQLANEQIESQPNSDSPPSEHSPTGSRNEEYRPEESPPNDSRQSQTDVVDVNEEPETDVESNSKPYSKPYSSYGRYKPNKNRASKNRFSYKQNMKNFKNYNLYEKYGKGGGEMSAEILDDMPRPYKPTEDDEIGALTMSAKAASLAGEFNHAPASAPPSAPTIPMGGYYYPYYKHGRKPSPLDSPAGFSHLFGTSPAWSSAMDAYPPPFHRMPFHPERYSHFDPTFYELENSKMLSSPSSGGGPSSVHLMPPLPPLPPPPPPSFGAPDSPKSASSFLLHTRDHDHSPYHHSDLHHSHHSHHDSGKNGFGSWQSGLVGFLLGVVPFSMLMASVVPAMGAMGGATALAPLGKRRRRKRQAMFESNQLTNRLEDLSRKINQLSSL